MRDNNDIAIPAQDHKLCSAPLRPTAIFLHGIFDVSMAVLLDMATFAHLATCLYFVGSLSVCYRYMFLLYHLC